VLLLYGSVIWLGLCIALPRFDRRAHRGANGSATISKLRTLAGVQRALTLRMAQGDIERTEAEHVLDALIADDAPWFVSPRGTRDEATRYGYRFRRTSAPAAGTSAVLAFVVHAWPESEATLDDRLFVLDASGVLWMASDPGARWRGRAQPLPETAGAPFEATTAVDARQDALGLEWSRVETLASMSGAR